MPLSDALMRELEAANEVGVKLEQIEGLPVWEFLPTLGHQRVIQHTFLSVRPRDQSVKCGCIRVLDLLILFPDGSFRRPDLSIFCKEPTPDDKAAETIPVAVVEVISADSRRKDMELSPPFYLKHGILDVVVIDPVAKTVAWFTREGRRDLASPQTIELQCGCVIDV